MTPSAASSGAGAPAPDIPAVTVTPGGTASTVLTVRNDSDIVEAYALEVVGDCAPWAVVEPERVSLYPGTSETVTIRLNPPRSPDVRAGEVPLGVRVLPAEHPESVTVPETTVHVAEFHELDAQLLPRRRRGWLRGRYRLAVRNGGNTPAQVAFTPGQAGEELRFRFTPAGLGLAAGESAETRLRVRTTGRPVWFGKPVVWPFTVRVDDAAVPEGTDRAAAGTPPVLEAEFVQIPVFPKWLLAVLAALIALVLAWFTLVRPAVRSTARQAADAVVHASPTTAAGRSGQPSAAGTGDSAPPPGGQGTGAPGTGARPGTGGTGAGGSGGTVGDGRQTSRTIEVRTPSGGERAGSYTVPAGKVFGVTDIVVANFQGDEGVLTISFDNQSVTIIALENFRNQDYHWVTPIEIPGNATVTMDVNCTKPGTPASGRQARQCRELLNVSGALSDALQ
ncbi:COG1470 family protein [Actinacidiphila sp. ITFR-21]|uniref:COG1470 family protein n=1 Tax=Actinacidiphila sp. ITFR-21 TaxID=3075199 RepID=UPI0028893A0E|nr:hydrolytic protein [Streptomyces sp. ITFR-21]WNI16146.1 hydrolytic protein [Streptomyces sp. ITFR-21]